MSRVVITSGDATFRVTLTDQGVSALEFVDAVQTAGEPTAGPVPDLARRVAAQLGEYLAGRRREFDVPVDLDACSPFQREVLEACARIPAGEVVTYGELARRVGRPGAARAVGTALARNPVPILVPCHRVLRGTGALGGFIAGLGWKRRLLQLEGVSLR